MGEVLGQAGLRDPDTRWHHLLQSGARTGAELARAWDMLKEEARQHCDYLGREVESPLVADVVAAGDGRADGGTRSKVVEQLERLRCDVLTEGLQRLPDRRARPAWAWNQRDKLCGQRSLALPGPQNGLSLVVFSEAMASRLCLPSSQLAAGG